ncbi:MAG: chromate transporter [Peptostreptococcaceae bacterium]|nr:chromate transporter [Peptostreptococcaceae bacterium]
MLIRLFLNFLKIGSLSFGGGYAVVSLVRDEIVDRYRIITSEQFIDLVGLSQISPGPLAINASTFVGFKTEGLTGATIATLGVVLIPIILSLSLSKYYRKNGESKLIKRVMKGIRPCVAPIILMATIKLYPMSMVDVRSYLIAGIVLAIYRYKKVSPIILLMIGGGLGFLFYGIF